MPMTSDTAEIKALEQRLIDGIKAKDVKQIMSCYSDDVFAYDVVPPRNTSGPRRFRSPGRASSTCSRGRSMPR